MARTRKRTPAKSRSGSPRRGGGDPRRSGRPDAVTVAPATARDWIGAARPRTLPLAIAPVVVGTGAAVLASGLFHWVIALACLAVSVCLQVGVNYANDYSDGIRGTDNHRVGPGRLTGARRAKPRTVLAVALVFFALAGIAGLAIVIRTGQWWLIAVGVVCIAAAWFYTGGRRPYGYFGLGELFVFVFFGLVATVGTTWVQALSVPQEAWFGAVAIGLLACAVLLANNLRDIDQDRRAGKRTLTVLIGKRATQVLFTLFVLVPFAISAYLALFYPVAWLTLLALLAGLPAILIVWTFRVPRELITALALTSLTSLGYAVLFAWALVA